MSFQKVTVILGTHTIGDSVKSAGSAIFDTQEDVQALLSAFHARGYKHLDTAANYAPGAPGTSEARLGEVNAASTFIIDTKVLPDDHKSSAIATSISESLDALRTDAVDTMYLHAPERTTPLKETVEAMHNAYQQGKFRRFGLSNYPPSEVAQIVELCERNGFVKPSVYQGHYNAVVRGGEAELFPLLRKHNMAFYAFSPATGGFFADNVDTSFRWSDKNAMGQLYRSLYFKPAIQAARSKVLDLAKKSSISGHDAALRWVTFHSALKGAHGDAIIFGVSKLEQVQKTLDAVEAGPLPTDLADAIAACFATFKDVAPAYHF